MSLCFCRFSIFLDVALYVSLYFYRFCRCLLLQLLNSASLLPVPVSGRQFMALEPVHYGDARRRLLQYFLSNHVAQRGRVSERC